MRKACIGPIFGLVVEPVMKTLSVTEAKPRLGSLVDRALRSEPVFIRRGSRVVQIVPAIVPDPVSVMPVGHYAITDERAAFLNEMPLDSRPLSR